ncbi:MAG: TIR domain-containing protein [Oscillospiraceae bacterium]|nr:TIR domain-containing protein [Oscillospiraceae bacterium]
MAVFKCECCGGNLDVINNDTSRIIQCPYCETQQTIPQTEDEKKINLYNRAVKLRRQCEFDKAEGIYESIVASYPDDAEAYWGLCLCKYGIEYVDDPATGKKLPTCHRTIEESILDDSDFEQVLENSDSEMIRMYRNKAKEIDRIQQSILEVAAKENAYDVFICYKETDENGQRTEDSVYAQDIYDSLTAKGFKVFFARITLEGKLGQAYEPYIFSALRSAKVMLVVGTSYEHMNAVWVKNEWQRFLQLRKKDTEKVLIPCYRDMDAYDLPNEFKNLQAVNLAAVGYLQDLARNIGKIITPKKAQRSDMSGVANIDSLMIRTKDFLIDRNWLEAQQYSERILDINPRFAEAHLTRLMSELNVSTINELDNYPYSITDIPSYRKFIEYADDKLKEKVLPHFEKAELTRKRCVYEEAAALARSKNVNDIRAAASLFSTITGWEDSDKQLLHCHQRLLKYAKKDLNHSKNIFRIFASVFWLAVLVIGVVMAVIGYTRFDAVTMDGFTEFLIGCAVACIGGIASIMRLFHWDSIGKLILAYFINGFTVCIFGAVAAIINLVRDRKEQCSEIKENRSIVNEINQKIEDLRCSMNT